MTAASDGRRTSTTPVHRTAYRILRQEPVAYALALVSWTTFQTLPVLGGVLLKVVLDRVQVGAEARMVWGVLAALAGVEVGRWLVLAISAWQWHGQWVFWHAVPMLNMLRSLVAAPGATQGRLPESPGEAVSRFRDDTKNLSLVSDVWLDITAVCVSTGSAILILAAVDWRAALVVVVPVIVALLLTRGLAGRLKEYRLVERRATAAVTGFIGDTYGAITAIKAAGAEGAVRGRFDALGRQRADAALKDQVATQTLQTLSGATANLSTGLALLLLAPALSAGEATVGDIGLFASAAIVIGGLPRWIARLGTYSRQAEVSLERMNRLLADSGTDGEIGGGVEASVEVGLRYGPGLFDDDTRRLSDLPPLDRLQLIDVEVQFDDPVVRVGPISLSIPAGSLTVVTGPVGSGKTTLLRAVLGLIDCQGEIRWNGQAVIAPSLDMVPPRVAYLPQVPRLFSETLGETIRLGLAEDRLDEALHTACLDSDLAAMTQGLDTLVGPKGVRLSGGQVQRAGAARAFLRQSDLLVIDDLSSALDAETEALVWERLLAARQDQTLIVVSHRERIRKAADQVIELGGGGGTVRPWVGCRQTRIRPLGVNCEQAARPCRRHRSSRSDRVSAPLPHRQRWDARPGPTRHPADARDPPGHGCPEGCRDGAG